MQFMEKQMKLVVIGGGAAGFFCAVNAARLHPGWKVIILEKSARVLSKVKVSGGGRCNVTHHAESISSMAKGYPRGEAFLKKAFHHFGPTDTIEWFRERGVDLKAEADGRMFPVTDHSQTIIDCLLQEASKYQVDVRLLCGVEYVRKQNAHWLIGLSQKKTIEANAVCIATGGFPKTIAYDWLKETGHTIVPPVPSLFTFNMPTHPLNALMGIAVQANVKLKGTKWQQQGAVLITHWGLSGPAVLKLSAFAARMLHEMNYHFTVIVQWLPEYNQQTLAEKMQEYRTTLASRKIFSKNPFQLPARLWELALQLCGVIEAWRWADVPAKAMHKLVNWLTGLELNMKGKTTFKEEFVTAGGIPLTELDTHTMQSKIQPGLFFAGEVIDVDGITGGYNFQNAWTTGWLVAHAIGQNT